MGDQKTDGQVTAVVAAYNEADRIGAVLEVLSTFSGFLEVVVVDDGSTDGTAEAVKEFPVRLLQQERNQGKAAAMVRGVDATSADVIFFCDADVRGLTHKVIEETVAPVLEGKTAMMVAMRNRKLYFLRFILTIIPLLGGERAVRRALWDRVPADYKRGFMIEAALNFYAKYWFGGFRYKVFPGLTQTVKELKYGFWKGFRGRTGMTFEVLRSQISLQLYDTPPTIRAGRNAVTQTLAAAAGLAIGALFIAAAIMGPRLFVARTFANELQEDPDAPFVHFLLRIATDVGAGVVGLLGLILAVLNLVFLAVTVRNVRFLFFRRPARTLRDD